MDFLQDTKASINLNIYKTPVTLNYYDALTVFRNQVNQTFLSELYSSNNRRTRRFMKFFSKAVAEVVDSKAEAEDTTAEEADAAEEEDMMASVDMYSDMAEAVGIIHLAGGLYQMQE